MLCRHTLEHIAAVQSFVRSIRDGIGKRDDVWVVFETPDSKRIFSEGAFWDIYYEHCSYFSIGAHTRLFRQERFDVVDVSLVYNDQYILQYARPAACITGPQLAPEYDLDMIRALAAAFPVRAREEQEMWLARIRSAAEEGQHSCPSEEPYASFSQASAFQSPSGFLPWVGTHRWEGTSAPARKRECGREP